MLFPLKDSSSR
uniref:Uncharacterized protein n=1 Tax=Lepeophtheirus salmonis TaxID=72036 RepID=A0A0K2VI67_LEPSM